MAEDSAELEGLETQLHRLLGRDPQRGDGQRFCSDFCTLVEQHASRWQLPLPQLRILQVALCYFTRASTGFTSNCDHVLQTLSSLALSIFELLLFFDQKDFDGEPLKQFSKTFQNVVVLAPGTADGNWQRLKLTCHLVLSKLQNVHFLQVERLVRGGGPWASPALQAILSESSLPQNEVDGCIGSEPPVFFELRVHYLLSHRRVAEAMALARCCARHPAAGQHSFFLQVYLTWLHKTSQHDRLHREVAVFSGKDAVHLICSLECEEEDELLLALCTAFLSQQLRRGDLYYLCDLVFVWTKLHSRLNTSKQALLQECHRLMLSATNVHSIFPFIRAILQEAAEAGIQFCVELCANALQSRLPCDVTTKTLIYKTIAGLLPNDLDVCRACALLVFFLERTVESYKVVYLLYMHPDQEYHVDSCPIGNHVRFETLQILKKDLCFDPELWNLIALRTNCLKLMGEKLVSAALEEIMEDKWISNYCTKESAFRSACQRERRRAFQAAEKKRRHKSDADEVSKRLKVDHAGKKRGYQGSRPLKDPSSAPLRRSFWQMDRLRDNGEHRRTTRLSEKNPQKRRIRKPRWLLEDSGTLEENSVPLKMKKHGLRDQKHHQSSVINRSEGVPFKNSVKHKPPVNFDVKSKENGLKHQKDFSLDGVKPATAPQVVLELSLPDNELLGTFAEESSSRQRGLPQVLLYKPTVKLPEAPQPAKSAHGKEVILRARDVAMLVQQLHCYSRKQKGKGIGLNAHGSVSTITRSSVQGSPPKDPPRDTCGRPDTAEGAKEEEALQPPAARAVLRKLSSGREISEKSPAVLNTDCEEPAVEMKVTIASQSPVLDKVCKAGEDDASQTSAGDKSPPVLDKITDTVPSKYGKVAPESGDGEQKSPSPHPEAAVHISKITSGPPADQNDLSALTLVTEMVRELSPEQLAGDLVNDRRQESGNCASEGTKNLHKMPSTSSCLVPEQELSLVRGGGSRPDVGPCFPEDGDPEDSEPETEESKLEYCCTFCSKEFKGRRVVEHAMFHYRRDECMFCGVTFKDDLLAMMHLSDHIEKLKRLKEPPAIKVKAKRLSDTKDTSTAKTSAKVQPRNVSSGKRGRPRKSTVCSDRSRPHSPPEVTRSKSRTLRSKNKPVDEMQLGSKATVHKLNGHAGRRKELKRLKHRLKAKTSQEIESDSATNHKLRKHKDAAPSAATPQHRKSSDDQVKTSESPEVLNTSNTKQDQKVVEDKNAVPEAKVLCPVDGCSWRKDLSKNRVALLYHALDDHHGDVAPLELAFSVGSGKCSICMRVLWSFEHFQHHVERHRLTPRHPCLHQGCAARFKTGIEMRRHTRKHSPLQAACCLPECSRLFICLWALNLHEREHYAQQSKDTNVQTVDRRSHTPVGTKTPKSKDAEQTSSGERRERPERDPRKEKPEARASRENRGKDSNVLENLSNKDTSTKPSAPCLRLRFREATGPPPKVHKGISSFFIKRSRKIRHKLKKKQARVNEKCPKRRGRPPKTKRDENAAGHKETIREAAVARRDQKRSARSPPKSAASTEEKEETRRQIPVPVKPAETAADDSKLRRSVKRSHVEEKLVSSSSLQPPGAAPENKTPKPNAARQKKSHTKSHKGTTRMVKNNHHVAPALKKRAKTAATLPQPESNTAAAGVEASNDVKPTEPGDSKFPVPPTTTEKPQSLQSEENPKPQSLQREEKPQSLQCEENPKSQSLQCEENPKPQSLQTEENPKPQSLQCEEKPQSLQCEENPKPQSLQTEENPKPQSLQTEENPKPQSRQCEENPKHQSLQPEESLQPEANPKPQSLQPDESLQPEADPKPQSLQPDESLQPEANHKPQSLQPEADPKPQSLQPEADPKLQSLQPEEKPKPKRPQNKIEKTQPPTEQVQKLQSKTKPKKPQKRKEKTSTDANKKANKKSVKEKRPRKSPVPSCQTSVLSQCEVKQQGGANGGAAVSTPEEGGTSGGSLSKSKRSKAVKKPDKVKRKREVDSKDGGTGVREQGSDGGHPSASAESPAQLLQEAEEKVVESSSAAAPPPQAPSFKRRELNDGNFSVCSETLKQYSKKPYLRLPPTVYLDEKFTTMPKRRKEMCFTEASPASAAPEPAGSPSALRRQRCASCFTTFHCAPELQRHLALKTCSTLFGFDSDNDD